MASQFSKLRATPGFVKWMLGLLKALSNIKGSNGIRVNLRPGVGIDVILDRSANQPTVADELALIRLTEASATDGWYIAEEVAGNDPTADPPTWDLREPGRTFGVESDDEGEVMHPLLITGLETTASGSDAIYTAKRISRPGTNDSFWMVVGAAGDSLPPPGSQYMSLLLIGDPPVPGWDWVRAHG
ncbi:MAG: hypothetical protein ACPGYV_08480 [Phycisphaeraceae bacterium]